MDGAIAEDLRRDVELHAVRLILHVHRTQAGGRHDWDLAADEEARLLSGTGDQIRTREHLRVPFLHQQVERRRQGDRTEERLNGEPQPRTDRGRRFDDRYGRLPERIRAARLKRRRLQRDAEVRLRRLVHFENVDLDVDLAVVDRVQPVDELSVRGKIGTGESARTVENRL